MFTIFGRAFHVPFLNIHGLSYIVEFVNGNQMKVSFDSSNVKVVCIRDIHFSVNFSVSGSDQFSSSFFLPPPSFFFTNLRFKSETPSLPVHERGCLFFCVARKILESLCE